VAIKGVYERMNKKRMNINQKLDSGAYTEDDLIEYLDSNAPILLYKVAKLIVLNSIKTDKIIKKLYDISNKLEMEYSILGYYKIGHLAMSTLIKLGISSDDIFAKIVLDEFEKETVINFERDSDWN